MSGVFWLSRKMTSYIEQPLKHLKVCSICNCIYLPACQGLECIDWQMKKPQRARLNSSDEHYGPFSPVIHADGNDNSQKEKHTLPGLSF